MNGDAAMPDDEGLREELARTLGEAWITSGPRAWDEQSEGRRQGARFLADALLPVVERYAAQRAAEALRAARDGGCTCSEIYCAQHDGPGQWM